MGTIDEKKTPNIGKQHQSSESKRSKSTYQDKRGKKINDLPHYLREYKLSVVQRSLFSADGKLLPTNDKSTLLREIEQLIEKQDDRINKEKERSVIIFDGMAVANKINFRKSPQIKSCKDYAIAFFNKIKYEASGFDEIPVIFDRYIERSLKSKTRDARTSGIQVRYKVADDTCIEHISTSQFLSHIETKNELAISMKIISCI